MSCDGEVLGVSLRLVALQLYVTDKHLLTLPRAKTIAPFIFAFVLHLILHFESTRLYLSTYLVLSDQRGLDHDPEQDAAKS